MFHAPKKIKQRNAHATKNIQLFETSDEKLTGGPLKPSTIM